MAAPTPVTETYVSCSGSTLTIGTTPDNEVLGVMTGGYTLEHGVDETTNSSSGGGYEDVGTTKKASGTLTVPIKAASMPTPKANDIFPIIIDNADGPYLACNARFNAFQYNILNVKEGLKWTFTITSQGAITTIRP